MPATIDQSASGLAPATGNPLTLWLGRLPSGLFGAYAGLMAFGVYFAMYAFRKPFAAASFSGLTLFGLDYKVVLVIAQVIGYAMAKLIGVKVIAELPARRRVPGILAQIALAELALVGFALIPAPWNAACLFLDGLALGMIWGMVFGFVEGRRQSELIAAILCASFILSSGVVKSVGEALLLRGVGPFAMPALTGALFAPMLFACLYGLATLPPPSPRDIAERVARVPMDGAARARLLRKHAVGLASLIVLYVMLAALMAFRDNRAALAANFALMALGLALAGGASLSFALHLVGPVVWMVLLGMGLYLAYTPFNGILFDRLVATGGTPGNAGFLIYVADSFGYGGTVALLLARNLAGLRLDWTHFLIEVSLVACVAGLGLLGFAWTWFDRRLAA